MTESPYDILGVPHDCSQDDIRRAYRKLARALHPDLNPGDASAEARFKKVSAAYELLKDPERRARFDRGDYGTEEAAPSGRHYYRHYAETGDGARYTSSSGFHDFADYSDLFSDLFGARTRGAGAGRWPGGETWYHVDVDLTDAVRGATRRITLADGSAVDLKIPAGAHDGTVLRLKGKGAPGIGGRRRGDVFVEIGVRPHPFFRRDGDDILLDLPITIYEAVLGAKVDVPTVSGSVRMTVPKGSSSGDILRLRGKGVLRADGTAGDQKVILRIVMPKHVDQDLKTLMEKWRSAYPYDPRSKMRRAA